MQAHNKCRLNVIQNIMALFGFHRLICFVVNFAIEAKVIWLLKMSSAVNANNKRHLAWERQNHYLGIACCCIEANCKSWYAEFKAFCAVQKCFLKATLKLLELLWMQRMLWTPVETLKYGELCSVIRGYFVHI